MLEDGPARNYPARHGRQLEITLAYLVDIEKGRRNFWHAEEFTMSNIADLVNRLQGIRYTFLYLFLIDPLYNQ